VKLLPLLRCKSVTRSTIFLIFYSLGCLCLSAQTGNAVPGPTLRVTGISALATSYSGPDDAVGALHAGQAQTLSLLAADFDEDGIADLVMGHAAARGGILTWHRGNIEAFAPLTEETFNLMAAGNFQNPVLPGASTFHTTVRPDLLAAGNFYTSGHTSLVVAELGGNSIDVFAGDGYGRFANPQTITLSGTVTALGSGPLGAMGQPDSVLIGVQGSQAPALLLYRSSPAGLVFVTSYVLPGPVAAFGFGDLDGHMAADGAAVLAGGQVLILHSDTTAVPVLKAVPLPFSASAMALGSFLFDRNRRLQIALLSPDGAIHIISPSGFDGRPWTAEELKVLQQVRLRKAPSPFHPVNIQNETWEEVERFSGVASIANGGKIPLLLRTRSGGSGSDDLTVLNREADQTVVLSHPYAQRGVAAFAPGQTTVRTGSTKGIVAAVAMRLNAVAASGVLAVQTK
jgi:hypothetical protein